MTFDTECGQDATATATTTNEEDSSSPRSRVWKCPLCRTEATAKKYLVWHLNPKGLHRGEDVASALAALEARTPVRRAKRVGGMTARHRAVAAKHAVQLYECGRLPNGYSRKVASSRTMRGLLNRRKGYIARRKGDHCSECGTPSDLLFLAPGDAPPEVIVAHSCACGWSKLQRMKARDARSSFVLRG